MGEMLEVPEGPLRHGYTTGACATACAKGALLALIRQTPVESVAIWIPAGQYVTFQLQDVIFDPCSASAATIKDGGDDPDATHGAKIVATVLWRDEPGVEIDGGVGVGRVTRPGLPVPVGEAAINPVPRKMIRETCEQVLAEHGVVRGVRVVISVPGTANRSPRAATEWAARHHWRHLHPRHARDRGALFDGVVQGEHCAGPAGGAGAGRPHGCFDDRRAQRKVRHVDVSQLPERSLPPD